MIETTISLLVVFSLVFWLFELCMFTYTCSILNNATREGVRYAIVHGTHSKVCSGPDGTCTDQAPYANVQAVVTSSASASLHDLSAMTVTVSYANGTAALGNPVAIHVVYTYIPLVTLPGLHGQVSFSSQGMIVF
jgi:Flp pilus assembly protein TadG